MNHKFFLLAGAVFGFLGVGLGAFGAHALKPVLEASGRVETFELAVRYQFYHAFALLFLGLWMEGHSSSSFMWAGWGFLSGILLFSGSLYLFALTGKSAFAMVTPIGGLALIAGWLLLIVGLLRRG